MPALFYQNPVLVNSALHAEFGLRKLESVEFARSTNAIPVNFVEFGLAGRNYPIAFTGDDNGMFPAIIVGLEQTNLFVEKDGQWRKGQYIPAYIRRYPFIFADQSGGSVLSLCVDDVPGVLDTASDEKLFTDGKPTASVERALEFCKAYHAAAMDTQAFTKALVEKDLLVERQAETQLNDGSSFMLRGFKTIDEAKLMQLDAETLADWSKKGWLAAAYAQILSSFNWASLLDLMAEKAPAAAPAPKSNKKLS